MIETHDELFIYPAKHFVHARGAHRRARSSDQARSWTSGWQQFKEQGKLLEAQRLAARTRFDIEMMQEVGYCPGIENYSRPLAGRQPGEPPDTLFDFFPDDFLLFVDESHVTVPQVRGMFAGDFSRKSDARRARLPPAQRARQPAAEVRRVGDRRSSR